MPHDACILTTKDFAILEAMLDRCLGTEDPMTPIIRRKMNTAQVLFRDDVPADVATLDTRLVFSVDGREADTRVISADRRTAPIGLLLPITTLRGLALLGLTEGQSFSLAGQDGVEETVLLEKVLYQPEAARREVGALGRPAVVPRKPVLRLIQGGFTGRSNIVSIAPTGSDDPGGPSAA